MSGLFIAIDGPGGAGKSTTITALADQLRANGRPVTTTTEPSPSPLGQFTRAHTGDYWGPALACLVAADRYHHLDTEIRPAVKAGQLVLCDRYMLSSLVLQAGIDAVPADFVCHLNALAEWPDLNVVLTAPVEELHHRLQARGSHGRFEEDPATTTREVALYAEVLEEMQHLGVATMVVDTRAGVDATVSRLTEAVEALWSHRHQEPAA